MSKFLCKCGHVINLSQGTSECEFTLLPERVIDEIGDKLESVNGLNAEDFYDVTVNQGSTVYLCSSCGRIHLEKNKSNEFLSYVLE